jgi:hypothetical protein
MTMMSPRAISRLTPRSGSARGFSRARSSPRPRSGDAGMGRLVPRVLSSRKASCTRKSNRFPTASPGSRKRRPSRPGANRGGRHSSVMSRRSTRMAASWWSLEGSTPAVPEIASIRSGTRLGQFPVLCGKFPDPGRKRPDSPCGFPEEPFQPLSFLEPRLREHRQRVPHRGSASGHRSSAVSSPRRRPGTLRHGEQIAQRHFAADAELRADPFRLAEERPQQLAVHRQLRSEPAGLLHVQMDIDLSSPQGVADHPAHARLQDWYLPGQRTWISRNRWFTERASTATETSSPVAFARGRSLSCSSRA